MIRTADGSSVFVHATGPGDAPALVFIHGFPAAQDAWNPQRAHFHDTHRVIAYDAAGLGRSRLAHSPTTMEACVDELAAVLDAHAVRRCALVGLSMGGYVALRAAERFPRRFSHLVLADTQSAADGDAAKLKRHAGIARVLREGVAPFVEGFLDGALANRSVRGDLAAICARNTPDQVAAALFTLMSRTDTTEGLGAIAVPTLVVVGEKDEITPPEAARALCAAIPGAERATIAGAGHFSNLENPTAFNAAVAAFLARNPS